MKTICLKKELEREREMSKGNEERLERIIEKETRERGVFMEKFFQEMKKREECESEIRGLRERLEKVQKESKEEMEGTSLRAEIEGRESSERLERIKVLEKEVRKVRDLGGVKNSRKGRTKLTQFIP